MIAILGYSGHGKDTLAKTIERIFGLSWVSVSDYANSKLIFPVLREKYNYKTTEECYDDRINHREEWFNIIKDYNKTDPCRIIREIAKSYDVVVGIRDKEEYNAAVSEGIITFSMGVYCPQKEKDNLSSMSIDLFEACDVIIGNPVGSKDYELNLAVKLHRLNAIVKDTKSEQSFLLHSPDQCRQLHRLTRQFLP